MPDPSCCNSPEPEPSGPDDKHADGLLDRIDCILDDSRNGTLLDVFGIEPPYFIRKKKIKTKKKLILFI